MNEVKLSSKNQIVIPREARDALGARPGSRIAVVVRNGIVTPHRRIGYLGVHLPNRGEFQIRRANPSRVQLVENAQSESSDFDDHDA